MTPPPDLPPDDGRKALDDRGEGLDQSERGDPKMEAGAQTMEAAMQAAGLGGSTRQRQREWVEFDVGGLKARLDNLEARVGRIQGNYVDKSEATLRAIQTTATAIAILLGVALTLLEISRLL